MTTSTIPTPAGWVTMKYAGYSGDGFVFIGGAGGKAHYSLYPNHSTAGWTLALILDNVAISSHQFATVDDAVAFVGDG